MSLTAHQQAMLDGRHGWPQQLGMRLLTAVAKAFDAQTLIPVASVHLSLSGVSVGEPGLRLFESLAARDGRFVVPTTLNVLSADRRTVGRTPALAAKEHMQLGILDACRRMGALATCSCNPFLLGFNPAFGESVAWNESASAPYVNAVLGARTNREGATALASALTGYTVGYGMHVDENRRASVIVDVEADVQGSDAFAVLGGAVARACGERIPVLEGLRRTPTLDEYTAFCASFATVGPLATFHIAGITPEAPTREAALDAKAAPTVTITDAVLEDEGGRYSTATTDRVDVVAIGCPHASLEQVREVADSVGSAHVHPQTLFVVQTSASIAARADAEGLAARLAAAGIELTADTCVHVAYREAPAGATLATNALKIAYLTASHDVNVRFGTLEQCVRAAVAGRWPS